MSSEQPNTSTTQPPSPPPPNFVAVLREMLRASDKVSDLIFSPGRPPQIELAGKLVPVRIAGLEKLLPAHTAGIAKLIIGNQPTPLESLEKSGSADVSFSMPGDARFRVNIFKQRGTHAIVMRVIPMRPPRFSDFNLPEQLAEIADINNGIVLVTGRACARVRRPPRTSTSSTKPTTTTSSRSKIRSSFCTRTRTPRFTSANCT